MSEGQKKEPGQREVVGSKPDDMSELFSIRLH
jgi:hypothetical protein